jgi:hypothetical protein
VRIFRGTCATTTTAANNQDPNGLLLFATVQSYPDVATGTGGSATVTREVALAGFAQGVQCSVQGVAERDELERHQSSRVWKPPALS